VLCVGICVSLLLLKRDRDDDGHRCCSLSRVFKRASSRRILLCAEPRDTRRTRYNAPPQRPSLSVEFKNFLRRSAALGLIRAQHWD
jgi:hypothetical protein